VTMTTNYEQLLALSTGLAPEAREYVVALLAENRELANALKWALDRVIRPRFGPDDDFIEQRDKARAILAKVQA